MFWGVGLEVVRSPLAMLLCFNAPFVISLLVFFLPAEFLRFTLQNEILNCSFSERHTLFVFLCLCVYTCQKTMIMPEEGPCSPMIKTFGTTLSLHCVWRKVCRKMYLDQISQ